LAVDDLLGAERLSGQEQIKVHQLTGIRELYHMLTGDYEFHGGYHADRVSLATTSDFAGLVKNALNKIVINQWRLLGRAGYDWWQRVTMQEHFTTLNTITGTLVGTVGTLPTVAEGAEYTELAIGDSPETATFYKYGGYIPLTLELIDRDETRKLRAYPRELANAAIRKLSALVAAVFTDNRRSPTTADTGALSIPPPSPRRRHANLLTTALSSVNGKSSHRSLQPAYVISRYRLLWHRSQDPSICSIVPCIAAHSHEDPIHPRRMTISTARTQHSQAMWWPCLNGRCNNWAAAIQPSHLQFM
jgi:hypothetical protein